MRWYIVFIFCCLSLVARADQFDDWLDDMSHFIQQYENIVADSTPKSQKYHSLSSLLDSIDSHHIRGGIPTFVLSSMIEIAKEQNDSLATFSDLLNWRNRIYNHICTDLSESYNYALTPKSLYSYDWISEGMFCLTLYKQKTLEVLEKFPTSQGSLFAFDALLRYKGLSLMAINVLRYISNKTGDEGIRKLSSDLEYLKKRFGDNEMKINQTANFDSKMEYYHVQDSLREKIRTTTETILAEAQKNNFYLNDFFIPWNNIQSHLKGNSLAIEFAECYLPDGKRDIIALLIDKDCDSPRYIPLCKAGELIGLNFYKMSELRILYDKIWLPILPYLKNIDTVYFSADGILHSCPIEYALVTDDALKDSINVCRLSSTRELVLNNSPKSVDEAVLFGDFDYDLNISETNKNSDESHLIATKDKSRSFKSRYGVDPLPETKVEVEAIRKIFEENKPGFTRIVMGADGIEEAFKRLSSKKFDVLHIATHGFLWTKEEAKKRNYISFLSDNVGHINANDSVLIRTGLLFSGANCTLSGKNVPDTVEDGVVTALEVANLDLSHVNMVVMSACESGLGETSGEGVFGLQRGFKLAGANTLLMSLWKVDDEATRILMTEFYRYYLSGMSKQESLHLAQLTLRNKPEFADPKYWAAFILLDALN
ncbi:MAG: CHAT domain-containing protein [Paramuribaculum sp.]|nr:CHAT domain-containing protein [Paramuribaculum sp.]